VSCKVVFLSVNTTSSLSSRDAPILFISTEASLDDTVYWSAIFALALASLSSISRLISITCPDNAASTLFVALYVNFFITSGLIPISLRFFPYRFFAVFSSSTSSPDSVSSSSYSYSCIFGVGWVSLFGDSSSGASGYSGSSCSSGSSSGISSWGFISSIFEMAVLMEKPRFGDLGEIFFVSSSVFSSVVSSITLVSTDD
jgi:hypothetical protein